MVTANNLPDTLCNLLDDNLLGFCVLKGTSLKLPEIELATVIMVNTKHVSIYVN